MKATFIGVPGEQHAQLHMYGQDFPLNQAVEIDNPQGRSKLARHPHFKVESGPEDAKEDRRIEGDFKAAGSASLAEVEAQRLQEEQDAVARSRTANQESRDGRSDPERTGVPASSQAAGPRSGGGRRGG
jgi:hypothetical protein